jgi:adenylate cyclase class 2
MGVDSSNREVEIKLRIGSAEQGRNLLTRAGFGVLTPRHFESNLLYDTPEGWLRERGQILRVRQVDGKDPLLTYKGPGRFSKHKVREELELSLSEAEPFAAILNRLGLTPAFRYEKYRTEFQRPGEAGLATLDETPIGDFLELEGPPDWIDATAERLGFSEPDYILLSYGRLYLQTIEANASLPPDMIFPNPYHRA